MQNSSINLINLTDDARIQKKENIKLINKCSNLQKELQNFK